MQLQLCSIQFIKEAPSQKSLRYVILLICVISQLIANYNISHVTLGCVIVYLMCKNLYTRVYTHIDITKLKMTDKLILLHRPQCRES